MKRISSVLIIFSLLIFISVPIFASSEYKGETEQIELVLSDFDNLSPNEEVELLLDHGLVLPNVYRDDPILAEKSISTIIQGMRARKEKICSYGYSELIELAKAIYELVEIDDKEVIKESREFRYTLVNSTVSGSWSDSYLYYNCYQYALGYTGSYANPGAYSGQSFNISYSISDIADLVQDDLDVLGFYSYKTTTKPNTLSSWAKVMCVRKGSIDYHVMKGIGVNSWYHKPSYTNPLLWNYSSPGYTYWTNECSYYGVSYPGDCTYDSSIYYIVYWSKNGPGPGIEANDYGQ